MRIFLGFDSKEPVALHVLMHSILSRASIPVSVTPLVQSQLRASGIYTRPRGKTESTEFSMTRFLVPYLSDYHGYSLFMDCDMVCLTDIAEILEHAKQNNSKDVWVCQHDYTPKDMVKFLGQQQTAYPRKNWSSVMLFNCNNQACRRLTPEYVNSATGLDLHRFLWVEPMPDVARSVIENLDDLCVCGHSSYRHATADHQLLRFECWDCNCQQFNRLETRIGSLPLEWNHLVGEYEPAANAKILHYTLGGPWFSEYANSDHAKEWFAERDAMLGVK